MAMPTMPSSGRAHLSASRVVLGVALTCAVAVFMAVVIRGAPALAPAVDSKLATEEGLRLIINASTGTVYDPSTGDPIRIRGVNWGKRTNPPINPNMYNSSAPQIMTELFPEMNHVRLVLDFYSMLDGVQMTPTDIYTDDSTTGYIASDWLSYIDDAVDWTTSAGYWITITFRNNVGTDSPHGNYKVPCNSSYLRNDTALQIWHDAWKFLAKRYKGTDRIAWYEVASEPHLTSPTFVADCGFTDEQVMDLLGGAVAAIRSVDSETPVAVSPEYNACPGLSIASKLSDPKVVYAMNWWCSTAVGYGDETTCSTAYKTTNSPCVPGCKDYDKKNKGTDAAVTYDKSAITALFQSGVDFQNKYKVPLWIDQLGCAGGPSWAGTVQNGTSQFLVDSFELINNAQAHWDWWTFMGGSMGILEQPCETSTCKTDYGNYQSDWLNIDNIRLGF